MQSGAGKPILRNFVFTGVFVSLSSVTLAAAELGTLSVMSHFNEPLSARLQINRVDSKVQPLLVRLAPPAAYVRLGRVQSPETLGLSLKVESEDPYIIRITGSNRVVSSEFPVIIELSEAGKLTAKFYTVRVQNRNRAVNTLPTMQRMQTQASQSVSKTSKLPSVTKPSVSQNKNPVHSTAVPQSAAPVALRVSSNVVRTETGKAPIVHRERVAVAPNPVAATILAPVTLPLRAKDYDLTKPLQIRPGMTLWSIGTLYRTRYQRVSMDQLLVSFVRTNPLCFEGSSIDGMKQGCLLRAPTQRQAQSVALDEAWHYVRTAPGADVSVAPTEQQLKRARLSLGKRYVNANRSLWVRAGTKPAVVQTSTPKPLDVVPVVPQVRTETKSSTSAVAPISEPVVESRPLVSTPSVTSEVKNEQAKPESAVMQTDQPKAEVKKFSIGSLWGLIGILIAAFGVAVIWVLRKNREKDKDAPKMNEHPVEFLKPAPTSSEQTQGVEQMLSNRLEADAAAERGFNFKKEPSVTAQDELHNAQWLDPNDEELGPLDEEEQNPAPISEAAKAAFKIKLSMEEAVSEENSETAVSAVPVASDQSLPSAAENSQQRIEPTYSGVTPGKPDALVQAMASKLDLARSFVSIGARDEAKAILMEVAAQGDEEQKTQAHELMQSLEA